MLVIGFITLIVFFAFSLLCANRRTMQDDIDQLEYIQNWRMEHGLDKSI